MIEKALQICDKAIKTCDHPGYSPWFIQDMTSHLINVQATIAREKPAADHGLRLSQEVYTIRETNRRHDNQEDVFWKLAARGNLAVSLIAVEGCQEALDVLLDLVSKPEMKAHEDIYLCNICLCLTQLDRLDEALAYNARAVSAIGTSKSNNNIQMAM